MDRRAARRRARAGPRHERLAAGVPSSCSALARRAGACSSSGRPTTGRSRSSRRHGASSPRSRIDEDGLDVDELERCRRAGRRPRSSTRSRPSRTRAGVTLSPSAAARLARARREPVAARARGRPVRARPLRGRTAPELFELEGGEHVMYGSSFSKTVAPGLRVGYVLVPAELAGELEALAASTYISPALLAQATRATSSCAAGCFEPNLERVCGLLRERRDAMLEALERELGGRARLEPARGRLLPLARASGGDRRGRAARSARGEAGVTFVQGPDFGGRSELRRALRSASSRRTRSREGVARLGAASGARRRRRSSCDSRIPPSSPIARPSRISQISEIVRGGEHEVRRATCVVVLERRTRSRTRSPPAGARA